MKIDFVVQNFPPETASVHYTSDVARAFAARGDDVRVITALPHAPTGKPYPGFGRLRIDIRNESGMNIWRLPVIMASNKQVLKKIMGFLSFMFASSIALLAGRRPDILVASLPSMFVWPATLSVSILRGIPTVLLMRDVEPWISLQLRGLNGRWWARLANDFWLWLYTKATCIVVVHASQLRSLDRPTFKQDSIKVIDHGVDLQWFDHATRQAPPFQLPKTEEHDLVAFYGGTFGIAQDLRKFVEVIAEPQIRELPISFVFVGDGEQRDQLVEAKSSYALDKLYIIDPIAHEAIPSLIRQADILIMSYKDTGEEIAGMIGSKFYEYCASGKPVIVHGPGVACELVRSQISNGWACGVGDPATLRQILLAALEDRQELIAKGQRGRSYAEQYYSKASRYKQWFNLLDEMGTTSPDR